MRGKKIAAGAFEGRDRFAIALEFVFVERNGGSIGEERILALGGDKGRERAVIIAGGDGVVFVIVAAGTGKRQTEENGRGGGDHVVEFVVAVELGLLVVDRGS